MNDSRTRAGSGTRGIQQEELQKHLRPDHFVVDLVNLEKSRRSVVDEKCGHLLVATRCEPARWV